MALNALNQFTILAGSFSNNISAYTFTPSRGNTAATLQFAGATETGPNPSWICLHPQNSSILYAVNEIDAAIGKLQSFYIDPTDRSRLTLIDQVSTFGVGPTHCVVTSRGEVAAANFGSPNMTFAELNKDDPTRFDHSSDVDSEDTVSFPVTDTQHPHMTLEIGEETFVPDFNASTIWRLGRQQNQKLAVMGQIKVQEGSRPRHIAYDKRSGILFTIHETNWLTAQQIPTLPTDPPLPLLANVSIVPDNTVCDKYAAAELVIAEPSDDSEDIYLFASNRCIGKVADEQGDTVAIFKWTPSCRLINPIVDSDPNARRRRRALRWARNSHSDCQSSGDNSSAKPTALCGDVAPTGSLTLVKQEPTELVNLRGMNITPPSLSSEQFLIVGGNDPEKGEGGVAVFKVLENGRELQFEARNSEVKTLTSFVAVP